MPTLIHGRFEKDGWAGAFIANTQVNQSVSQNGAGANLAQRTRRS